MNVLAATPDEFPWLAERVGCPLTTDFKAIKAIDSSGTIKGMIGYCDWTANSVRAHMAVDTPIAWRALRVPTFEYPFEQCDCGVLYGAIIADNVESLRTAKALGLREWARLPDGWAQGVDLVLLKLTREDWRVQRADKEAA